MPQITDAAFKTALLHPTLLHPDRPHLGVTLHVLFEVRRRLELFFAGLAGVDSDARQLFAMLLQVKGELALQDKLIAALWTDQILQGKRGGNGNVTPPERSAAWVL